MMLPMTAKQALAIEFDPYAHEADRAHARRLLVALVEWREAESAYRDSFSTNNANRAMRAETKLAALERGEEPKE